jgi:hypothetical protein
MSLKSYFKSTKKYQLQSDLQNMSADDIINIYPEEVDKNIDKNASKLALDGIKRRAMYALLAIKSMWKLNPSEEFRQKAINQFLVREGLKNDNEVNKLIQIKQMEVNDENAYNLSKSMPSVPYHSILPNVPTTTIKRAGKRNKKTKKNKKSKKRLVKRNKKLTKKDRKKEGNRKFIYFF